MPNLPGVAQRFIRYVRIDTQSDPRSKSTPTTEKQKDLARLLLSELVALGVEDTLMDEWGYVFGTLPSTLPDGPSAPVVGLLAHMDTAPDETGTGVRPIVHPPYDGGVISLPGDPSVRLDPAWQPALLRHVGENLITSDGTTLLGSDDKAGVAVLMQLAEDLVGDRTTPHPTIRLCFTIDEEVGRGVDHLDLDRFGADVAYTLDGSSIDTFSYETFNAAAARLTIEGVMVHPGYAKGVMVNAARILAEIISALPPAETPEATANREGYIHAHHLSEGDAARAEAEFILRDFTDEGMQRRKDYLTAVVETFRIKYPKAKMSLNIEDQYKNMRSYIEEADPRTISFAFAAAEEMGITLEAELVRGGTDGSRLSEMGLPTPNVFNGGYDYHSRFEWNTVQNLEHALAYTRELVTYWGEHGDE